jgi:hypothetical protein
VPQQIKDAIKKHAEATKSLLMCHEICNGTKHLKLITPRGGGARYHSTESTVVDEIVVTIEGWIDDGSDQQISAKELARQCLGEWERILQSHGLAIARMS